MLLTLLSVQGVCLAAPEPTPQIEGLIADVPILQPIIDIVSKILALVTGILGELLNLSAVGGLLESLLSLGNEGLFKISLNCFRISDFELKIEF